MEVYSHSTFVFCPRGDSYARKATFDALAAGAIPVHLNIRSFNYSIYSKFGQVNVFLDEKKNVLDQLLRIPWSKIQTIQENIRKSYPAYFYLDPNYLSMPHPFDAMELYLLEVCSRQVTRGGAAARPPARTRPRAVLGVRRATRDALPDRTRGEWHELGDQRFYK